MRVLVLVVLAGCAIPYGRNAEPDAAAMHDSSTHDAITPDASASAPCNLAKPFGTPVKVAGLDAITLFRGGSLSADELTVFWINGYNVWMASRLALDQPFGTASVATTTPFPSYWPKLSPDGLSLYWHADDSSGSPPADLYVSHRAVLGGTFSSGAPLMGGASKTRGDGTPSPVANALYFESSGNAIQTGYYRAPFVGSGIGTPVLLPGLYSNGEDGGIVSLDELAYYIASPRSGTLDVWVATRPSAGVPFGAPVRIDEVSTSGASEWPTFISADGCRLYFERETSSDQLLVATRPL